MDHSGFNSAFGSRAGSRPALSIVVATAMLLLGFPGPTAAAVDFASVTDHVPVSSAANHPDFWCEDGVKVKVSKGVSSVLPAGRFSQVIVKAGSKQYANTVFGEPPLAGQTVWADTNGDAAYNPGGRGGDKNISHIIYCPGESTPNQPPVAEDDAYTLDEDTTLDETSPGVLGNDTDPDTDPLTTALLTEPDHGTATVGADGALTYAPTEHFNGEDAFTYQACDPAGACDTATATLTVTAVNDPPVADAGPDRAATVGEDVAFDGSGSWDVDNDPLTYLWVFVSRPDGSTAAFDDATRVKPTFTVDFSGDYTVELTVDDGSGATGTDEVTVTASEVPNTAPVADPNGPYSGTAGSGVSFDGSGSYDLDGTIVSYAWDFGDGNTGSGVAPNHTYDDPGLYTVTLTVTDEVGATDTDTTNADVA